MRVSAAGNMPLQGLVKPPAKPVVMIVVHNMAQGVYDGRWMASLCKAVRKGE